MRALAEHRRLLRVAFAAHRGGEVDTQGDGVPYVWGGATPRGFDCSGFTMYVYRRAGSRGDLQPGDLVLFDGLGHEVLYIGGNQMIHVPHTGDVVEISVAHGLVRAGIRSYTRWGYNDPQ